MRIDLTTCRDPDLLAAEVRRLQGAITALADQDATLSVCDRAVTVTMDATLTDAEREALGQCAQDYEDSAALCRERAHDGEAVKRMKRAMVLRGLLERLAGL